jgi:ribA/ribD-fused uncharacterized protein
MKYLQVCILFLLFSVNFVAAQPVYERHTHEVYSFLARMAQKGLLEWNDNIKQLLYDVNIAKFNQYPELVTRLLETKTAVLGAYIPNDNLIGIGMSLVNIQSKNPINWTGQNLLGKALMDIREKFRMDMALASDSAPIEGAPIEGAPPQKVVRRRKPAVAKQDAQLQPATEPQLVDETAVLAPVVAPRTVRRRPRPALAAEPPLVAAVEQPLEAQQPISLANIPITINKQ